MKKVIIDTRLYEDILTFGEKYDSFCIKLRCSLVRLNENSELYACVRGGEGIPCPVYLADSHERAEENRNADMCDKWIEAIRRADTAELKFYEKILDVITGVEVTCGEHTRKIAKPLAETMRRLSTERNKVLVISHEKRYEEADKEEFQSRSVISLSELDSSVVDILYFDGADKLVEKLLYAGCRELNIFVPQTRNDKNIVKTLRKLSKKAPFSNRIAVAIGDDYAPGSFCKLIVGSAEKVAGCNAYKVFFSTAYESERGKFVYVGQNTVDRLSEQARYRLKPHAVHYITSIMSELILAAISEKKYTSERLYKVNAKDLTTETIYKED